MTVQLPPPTDRPSLCEASSVWISVKRWGTHRGLGARRWDDGGFGGLEV